MSCGTCVQEAAPVLNWAGISTSEAMAAWAVGPVAQVWEFLPRCPRCKKWVSPRTGICRYSRCGLKGTQVTETVIWPPVGISLLRSKARVQTIRAETGQPAPQRPMAIVDANGNPLEAVAAPPDTLFASAAAMAEMADAETSGVTPLESVVVAAAPTPPLPKNQGDFVITDEMGIGQGSPKAKCRGNIEAIRLLKQLEAEGRDATPEEMQVLARYVGWGGLSKVFDHENEWHAQQCVIDGRDPSTAHYKPEYFDEWKELRELLTDEEWESAKASTPNAHYTSPEVIRAMWDGLRQLGFDGEGMVLEPAAGIGHFFGCEPSDMTAKSTRAAVELDSISGRIARKLYPNANVQICGFQEAALPDSFFDVAISNVPFGNYAVYDSDYTGGRKYLARSIHNYFFAKALDKVRPGGVIAFITSHHTMDSADPSVREYLASRADLLGAIRLPNNAFQDNAMTQVTTDIIFLRKREEGEAPGDTRWVHAVKTKLKRAGDSSEWELPVNQYFLDHPEQMLGQLSASGSMYSGKGELTLEADGRDLKQSLGEAMQRLPAGVYSKPKARCPACKAFISAPGAPCNNPDCPLKKVAVKPAPSVHLRDGSLSIGADGKVHRKRGAVSEVVEVNSKDLERVAGMVQVRDAARKVLALNVAGASDTELAEAQAELNRVYDEFVAKCGPLSNPRNKRLFADDPDLPFMLALEDYDKETNTARKAQIFSQRTINPQKPIEHVDTAKDALLVSLNEVGGVDWGRMTALTGLSEAELQAQLVGQVFKTPSGQWETADEYLSGDVRKKLREAEAAAQLDPAFQANVDALRAVQPRDLTPSEICAALGSGWIPPADVEAFARALFRQNISIRYIDSMAKWVVAEGDGFYSRRSAALTSTWGTDRVDGMELLEHALNGKIPTVYDTFTDSEGNTTRVVNQSATLDAREMQDKIKARFKEWVWEDPDRATRLVARYNELYNSVVPRRYDGSHLTLPGMGADMPPLRAHQKDGIWRVVRSAACGRNTLLGHIVGAGKTYTMIGAGMELRRLGLRKKPMHVVPNHMLEQYTRDFMRMYPGAKVLMVSAADLSTPEKRQVTMSRIATDDWDSVVVTHSAFEKLPVKDETFNSFLQQEIDTLEAYLKELREEGDGRYSYYQRRKDKGRERTVKEIEKAKKRLEAKLRTRANRGAKDTALTWEELGVDQLFVDEADKFKNLYFPTQRTRVAGIPQAESNRAFDMFIKIRFLSRRCAACGQFVGADGVCKNCRARTKVTGGGVVFATGTPIANSIAEMYTMQRYLQLDRLRELGLGQFDAWASQFGDTVTALEMKPTGDGYREFTRFAKFNNVPELLRLFWEVADIKPDADALGLKRPELESGKPISVTVPAPKGLEDFIRRCAWRADRLGHVDPKEDNMLKIVSDANKAALDMRLVDPNAPDDPNSKINTVVNLITDEYRATTGMRLPGVETPVNGTQIVFLDISTPGEPNEYEAIRRRCLEAGISAEDFDQMTYSELRDELKRRAMSGRLNKGSYSAREVARWRDSGLDDDAIAGRVADNILGDFNAYFDIKKKLVARGIPADEIVAIHDAQSDEEKLQLFDRINAGRVRVFLASTEKAGSGTNVQRLLTAEYHVDAPWRPRDVEQRVGRIRRQGNLNPKVKVFQIGTEKSFDVYKWQMLESKARFIGQVMTGDLEARSVEDLDAIVLGYAEMKALATGNPVIIEKIRTENDLRKLYSLRKAHQDRFFNIQRAIRTHQLNAEAARARVKQLEIARDKLAGRAEFEFSIGGRTFTTGKGAREEAGKAFLDACQRAIDTRASGTMTVGEIRGCPVRITVFPDQRMAPRVEIEVTPELLLPVELGSDPRGAMTRLQNVLDGVPAQIAREQRSIAEAEEQIGQLTTEMEKPFEHKDKIEQLEARLAELTAAVERLQQNDPSRLQVVGDEEEV